MVAERRRVGLLLAVAALALLAAWLWCGNVSPRGSGRASLQLLHSLLVDRDLDFYAESFPLAGRQPPAGPPASPVGAFLLAPAFSVAHIASAFADLWPPDGLNPNYGLAAGLMTLAAILMGLAVLARVMVREGTGAGSAAAVTVAYLLASPLAWIALREPGSDDAFAFLLVAMLVGLWRSRSPQGWVALAIGATLVCVQPAAAGWLLIALIVYRRAPAGDFDDRVLGAGLIAIVVIPIVFLARRGLAGGAPPVVPAPWVWAYPVVLAGIAGMCWLAIEDRTWWLAAAAIAMSALCARSGDTLLAQASPVLALGFAEACRRLVRRGLVIVAVVGCAALIAGNLALCAARAADVRAPDPLHAVAWIAEAPLERLARALAPGDGALPPALVLREHAAVQGWVIAAAGLFLLVAVRLAFGRPGIVALFIAVGFTNAGGMLLLKVADSGVRRAVVYEGGAAFVDSGHLVHRWRPGRGRVATAVDVVTSLEPLMGLSVADELALLIVKDVHGREVQFGIFAGMDTAEETGAADLSPARRTPDRRPPPALGMLKTRLASYAAGGLRAARPYVAQTYRKICYLPYPLEVDEVRIQRRHGGARLNVHGLWLFTEARR